ncbi:thioredoxin-like protein [Zychaea mexicana]|uniref:thioredoxin-like protein n=1 Tax=Zychaea mexicana TaxID=64656 RepID=UPI0022FF1B7A|nr:thioredoxin-like protein [Zychaea mexicana]KAI9495213.1 thioredoxin-like protein [Zychaea mexicana]
MSATTSSATAEKNIVVYNSAISPFGHRVLMALKLVGAKYELVTINMQERDEYRKINPEGKVPAVKYGEALIPESMVIIELLHELYPEARLFTTDPVKNAKMRFVIRLFEDQILPAYGQLFGNPPVTKERLDSALEIIHKFYKRLNELLLEQSPSGPYFLGTEYSSVDIALTPFISTMGTFTKFLTGQDLTVLNELPRLRDYLSAVVEHPVSKETTFLDDEDKVNAVVTEHFKVTKNMFT